MHNKMRFDKYGDIEFTVSDKRTVEYYGRSINSNESKWRTDILDDNEILYTCEFGWSIILDKNTMLPIY